MDNSHFSWTKKKGQDFALFWLGWGVMRCNVCLFDIYFNDPQSSTKVWAINYPPPPKKKKKKKKKKLKIIDVFQCVAINIED